jgi:hypothetical protein
MQVFRDLPLTFWARSCIIAFKKILISPFANWERFTKDRFAITRRRLTRLRLFSVSPQVVLGGLCGRQIEIVFMYLSTFFLVYMPI